MDMNMEDTRSTDTAHVCVDGEWTEDAEATTESNEYGDRWCSLCGERVIVDTGGPQ